MPSAATSQLTDQPACAPKGDPGRESEGSIQAGDSRVAAKERCRQPSQAFVRPVAARVAGRTYDQFDLAHESILTVCHEGLQECGQGIRGEPVQRILELAEPLDG